MQIVVKSIKFEEENKTDWYRSIEGRLIKDEQFELTFNENCAFNYHFENNEGHIYLYSVNDKSPQKIREHKIFIKFFESEKQLAQEIVQKYLVYRTRFWDSVNEAFNDDRSIEESDQDSLDFSFNFDKILNSSIPLPNQLINKEYSLPIVIPINDMQTLELLAAGIHGLENTSIITLDTIEEAIDYHKTVFITNKPDELRLELKTELKKKQVKETISLTSKVLATSLSVVGVGVVAFAFLKNNFNTPKKR